MRSWELQQAIHARLLTWPALVALGVGLHDHKPQGEEDPAEGYPYNVIGEDLAAPFAVDDSVDSDHIVTIHQWSRYRGKKEVKQIQQANLEALHHNPFEVADGIYVDCNIQTTENFTDDDGLTRHGVQKFVFLIDGVTP